MFQFQTGSIKGFFWIAFFSGNGKFQFQTGSIKGHTHMRTHALIPLFQFQTGSIKGLFVFVRFLLFRFVSIPDWFD